MYIHIWCNIHNIVCIMQIVCTYDIHAVHYVLYFYIHRYCIVICTYSQLHIIGTIEHIIITLYLQCRIHPALTVSIALEKTRGYAGVRVVCQGKAGCNMLDVLSTESGISVAISSGECAVTSWIVKWSTINISPKGNAFKSKAVGISISWIQADNVFRNWIADNGKLIPTLQITVKHDSPVLQFSAIYLQGEQRMLWMVACMTFVLWWTF